MVLWGKVKSGGEVMGVKCQYEVNLKCPVCGDKMWFLTSSKKVRDRSVQIFKEVHDKCNSGSKANDLPDRKDFS